MLKPNTSDLIFYGPGPSTITRDDGYFMQFQIELTKYLKYTDINFSLLLLVYAFIYLSIHPSIWVECYFENCFCVCVFFFCLISSNYASSPKSMSVYQKLLYLKKSCRVLLYINLININNKVIYIISYSWKLWPGVIELDSRELDWVNFVQGSMLLTKYWLL